MTFEEWWHTEFLLPNMTGSEKFRKCWQASRAQALEEADKLAEQIKDRRLDPVWDAALTELQCDLRKLKDTK